MPHGSLGLIESGSRGSRRGRKADRQMSSTALAETIMKRHEVPLKPIDVPIESIAGYNFTAVNSLGQIVLDACIEEL